MLIDPTPRTTSLKQKRSNTKQAEVEARKQAITGQIYSMIYRPNLRHLHWSFFWRVERVVKIAAID
jgi:hypothetical protein